MTESPADPRARPGHFIAGDPLRGLSALGVVTFHCALFAPHFLTGRYYPVTYGTVGDHGIAFLGNVLNIFFVLSGFLISRPFVRWIIGDSDRPDIRQYSRNRVLRILPAFWAGCLIALAVHGVHNNSLADVVGLFGFLQIIPHGEGGSPTIFLAQGWTLSLEAMFYVSLPIIAIAVASILRRRDNRELCAIGVLAVTVIVFVSSIWARGRWGGTLHNQRLPQSMFYAFMPGIALAAVEPFVPRRPGGRWIAASAVLAGFVVLATLATQQGLSARESAIYLALGSGLIVGGALLKEWSTASSWVVLDNRFLHWAGERSLGLYVFHLLVERSVFAALSSHHPNTNWEMFLLSFVISVPLVLVAAAASWRFIETPALRHRHTTLQPPLFSAASS